MHHFQCHIEELEARRLLSADLVGSFTGKIPGAISLKSPTRLSIKITDTGAASFSGAGTLTLYASADNTITSADTQLAVEKLKLNLKPGKSSSVTATFNAPTTAAGGSYFLAGLLTPANSGATVFLASSKIAITVPYVDLTGTASLSPKTTNYTVGGKSQKPLALTVNVVNHGNVPAKGPVAISLFGSSNTTLDPLDPLLTTLPAKTLTLNPGKSKKYTINLKPTASTQSGKFFGIVEVNSGTTIKTAIVESDIDNDTAVTSNTFTITNPAKSQKASFVGALSDNITTVIIGSPELVAFNVSVTNATPTTAVELDEVDSSGTLIGKVAEMVDDGSLASADDVTGDGIYSCQLPIAFDAPGTRYFIAKLSDSTSGATGQTSAISVSGTAGPTPQELAQDDASSNAVVQPAIAIAANHGTAAQIISAIQTSLQSDNNVAAGSISTTSDSIIWENLDGTLECVPTDMVLGGRGSSEPVQTFGSASQIASAAPASQVVRPATPAPPNGSSAIVFDPFNELFAPGGDEAPGISQILTDARYDTTYLAPAQITSLDQYSNLGSNAALVFVTHGVVDNQYGAFIATGVSDAQDPTSDHGGDLEDHGLMLVPSAALLRDTNAQGQQYMESATYLNMHIGAMDKSIVYLGACHLGETKQMPNAILADGAAAVIAYTGVVYGDFAMPHGLGAFNTLVGDTNNTVGDIPGIDVDVVTTGTPRSSLIAHAGAPTDITPDGLSKTGILNRFLHFGDLKAVLPGKPKLVNVNLVVTYTWPNTELDLDSRTTFAGGSAGFNLPGGTYLNWLGDQQGAGEQETTIVDLYDAWKAGIFSTTTIVGAGADWYVPDDGKGPATINIALEDINTEKQYEIQTLVINPGSETEGATSQQGAIAVILGGDPADPTVTVKLTHS